jgi:hypothetical protein
MGFRPISRRILRQHSRETHRFVAQRAPNQLVAVRGVVTFVEEQVENIEN